MKPSTISLPTFDFAAFTAALNARRRELGRDWGQLAADLWDQSAALNARSRRGSHHVRWGTVPTAESERHLLPVRDVRAALDGPGARGLYGRTVVDVGDTRLPRSGPDCRLRWDLGELHAAVDEQRRKHGLTWSALADVVDCSQSRLTNLRVARQADLALVMRLTQWLHRPAAAFIHPTRW